MSNPLNAIAPQDLLIFMSVLFAISVSNSFLMRRLRSFRTAGEQRRVSVLVPARDEEESIGPCVLSLLAQDYPDFEVIVLDDDSQDRTAEVLAGIESDRLRVLPGEPLPEGWTGKPWACWQLAELAGGELLFFTDADTLHEPDTLRQSVAALESLRADFISAIVRNEIRTLGEQVTVPFTIWSVVAILPLAVAYILPRSGAFSAAHGKFMLFRRGAYDGIGGHSGVRTEAAEDLTLCRLVKAAGFKWRLLDATECVSTRMYRGFREALSGFGKNYFALFDYRVLPALFVWCWMLIITWHPLVTAVALGLQNDLTVGFWSAVVTIPVSAAIWLLISIRMRMPWHTFLLYPATMTIASCIGFWSMALTISGRNTWKGRTLVRHRVRLL
jgi:chlorobactene glucosyltransferase